MKPSSLVLVLAAALTLSVGCAKKAALPGEIPVAAENAPTKQGVKPTGDDTKIVEMENEAGRTQGTASLLDGGWQSQCEKTLFTTHPKPHITTLYSSYRYYITISRGALYEQLFYFIGETCESYDLSIESGLGDLWFFDILENGVVNGAPIQVNYTEVNFETTGDLAGRIHMKEAAGKQSITFDDSNLVFTRDK